MDAMFGQWVHGQPWWMTLLLTPVIVLAAMAARIVRYALLALATAIVLAGIVAWMWARRR